MVSYTGFAYNPSPVSEYLHRACDNMGEGGATAPGEGVEYRKQNVT